MNKNSSMDENRSARSARLPLMVAVAVAIFGVLAMVIVDHGPWAHPKLQTVEIANH